MALRLKEVDVVLVGGGLTAAHAWGNNGNRGARAPLFPGRLKATINPAGRPGLS